MSPVYGLALHTSSRDLGLAISDFKTDTRAQSWDLDRELSNYLHLYLADFIKPQTWSDLAFLAVAKGPGSFTSLRLGLVTARTLAQQLNLPLFCVSSLASLAYHQRHQFAPPTHLALQMPATRGQVYGAIYQILTDSQVPRVYLSDRLLAQDHWLDTLHHLTFNYHLQEVPPGLGDSVSSLLELAHLDYQAGQTPPWSAALPFYG